MIALALALASPAVPADAAVMAPIDALFAAFEAGDSTAILRHVYPEGRVTAVGTLASGFSGLRLSSWTEFAARMKLGGGFKERITSPTISIDADIALVWAPFTIEREGKIVSCGTDHFDLVRQAGAWKVMNITFSSRTTGCPAE